MSDFAERVARTQHALNALQETLEYTSLSQPEDVRLGTGQGATGAQKKVLSAEEKQQYRELSEQFIEFTYENPTVYHVVDYFGRKLEQAGYTRLDELTWETLREGKYYFTRGGSSLVAFSILDWDPSSGIAAICAHSDSVTMRVKPVSARKSVDGYELLGTAPYANSVEPHWLDRDLGIGGRVIVKQGAAFETRLINSTPHPIAKIPSLAVHFGDKAKGPFDLQDTLVPVIGYTGNGDYDTDNSSFDAEDEKASPLYGRHSINLLRYIAGLAGVKVSQLVELDLDLFDVQRGALGGLKHEFVFAPRLDDRLCCFAAIQSLLNAEPTARGSFNVVALFDNEEIGSLTRQGAQGNMLSSLLDRVIRDYGLNHQLYANSFILSADVNHLTNPDFSSAYEDYHKPRPNVGLTINIDINSRLAGDAVGLAFAHHLAAANHDVLQLYTNRNGRRSGGTIGPMLASATGIRALDLGIPQMAMHSIRAVTGTYDLGLAVHFFTAFFSAFSEYQRFATL